MRAVYHEITRSIRGGVTIPLKIVKSNVPKKKKTNSYSDKEFKILQRSNVGIAHKLRSKAEDGYDVDPYADADTIEDTELDASDYGPLFKDAKKDAEKEYNSRAFHNIKRKYFKDSKPPNMVTYIEKQQMKYLHREDPELWSIDKLAESFPASAEIVKKILKSKFTAYTVEQVLEHDKRVRKNWDLFQKGRLHVDEELTAHYAKFVGRLKFETNRKEIEKFLPTIPNFNELIPNNEFGSIISSSKKNKLLQEKKQKQIEFDDTGHIIYVSNKYSGKVIAETDGTSTGAHLTLDEFRKKAELRPLSQCTELDKIIKSQNPKTQLPQPENESSNENIYENVQYTSSTGVVNRHINESFFDKKMSRYPMRINIPRHLQKHGKIYRMRDCFYDDQGNFLYRVPGLTM